MWVPRRDGVGGPGWDEEVAVRRPEDTQRVQEGQGDELQDMQEDGEGDRDQEVPEEA